MPRVWRSPRFAAALLALALLAGDGIAVAATRVRCGSVIDAEQAVLDRDLRCKGTAIVVRNPRTVVQLNGHTIESQRDRAARTP